MKHRSPIVYAGAALVLLLLLKFNYASVVYDVPFGYDPGIYRYLFIQYADALKSFSLPELAPWAQEYPRAFYLLVAPFMILGVPVDMFLGVLWNVVPVLLAVVLAYVTAKRSNIETGVAVLLLALISQAYFDGFYAMYMKVYVSLIFVVLTYHLANSLSYWFPVTALLAVLIHQQTGLVLTVALGCWWLLQAPARYKEKRFIMLSAAMSFAALVGVLLYVPQWERAIWSPLKSIFLLRGDNVAAGSFPEATFYLQTMLIVLVLGVAGFVASFKKERGSLWQLSVLISVIFVVFRLAFYKRFFLLLDFFLLPYAAAFLVSLWQMIRKSAPLKLLLIIIMAAQCVVSIQAVLLRKPSVLETDITRILQVAAYLPDNASVIALENYSGTWLRGWVPYRTVGAPGLFDYPGWTYEQWAMFIDGSRAERRALLQSLKGEVYFFLTPQFTGIYGERTKPVLTDPCLERVTDLPLLHSVCSS